MVDRLGPELSDRLRRRLEALAPLGSLAAEEVVIGPEGEAALAELAERLRPTYPFGEPNYAGQMLKPPHPIAWAAYAATMLLNPNNHALDGGPATSELEREAVGWIAEMFGFDEPLAHLTSSGTFANLEALWIAKSLHPDKVILSGENAHYTHERLCSVLSAPHETVPQDELGRMDMNALESRLRQGRVGTVVVTAGTTSLGALDDVAAAADLCEAHGARLHVDAAYGGFFALLADGREPGVDPRPFKAFPRADSLVVDPHKHGLQPYGCGCVIFRDAQVARFYLHDSPYTYFSSRDLHPGETTLECSRAGAAAAALWATLRALPLTREGLGSHLAGARAAGLALAERLQRRPRAGPRARSSTSSASFPTTPQPLRSRRVPSARSRRSPGWAGTSRSCVSTPSGCAALARGSKRMRRRRRCCASACSSPSISGSSTTSATG